MKKKRGNKLTRVFRSLYLRVFRLNDSPQRIALGLGLGVFLGIVPGTGPIAAIVLAGVLRISVLSAFLGSIAVNTWLSIVTFILSIKVGAFVMRLDWQDVYNHWMALINNFHWKSVFNAAVMKTFLPVFVGNVIVALVFGFFVYLLMYFILSHARRKGNHARSLRRAP